MFERVIPTLSLANFFGKRGLLIPAFALCFAVSGCDQSAPEGEDTSGDESDDENSDTSDRNNKKKPKKKPKKEKEPSEKDDSNEDSNGDEDSDGDGDSQGDTGDKDNDDSTQDPDEGDSGDNEDSTGGDETGEEDDKSGDDDSTTGDSGEGDDKSGEEDDKSGDDKGGNDEKKLDCTKLKASGVKKGDVLPNLLGVDDQGNKFSLHDLCNSAVLLEVSTGWCGPCNQVAPHLQGLYEKYKDQGFEVVTVLAEGFRNGAKTTEKDLQRWKSKHGLTHKVVAPTNATARTILRKYWNDSRGYPSSKLMAPGMVVHSAAAHSEKDDQIESALPK